MGSIKSKVAAAALVAAASLAAAYEGYRDRAYVDPVGVVTVCEGHTGRDIVPGRAYTPAECAEFKRTDLLKASAVVDACITAPLTVGQRASLVDFAYNVGPGREGVKDGLCTLASGAQPTIRILFNRGRYAEACAQYTMWNRQKLRGITKRRESERQLCLS